MSSCLFAKQKVDKRILPLAELRDLASAESVDAFTEAYLKLLENHPDCPVRSCSLLRIKISINSDFCVGVFVQVFYAKLVFRGCFCELLRADLCCRNTTAGSG